VLHFFLNCRVLFWRGAGGENVSSAPSKTGKNRGDLLWSFALAKDHLGHSVTQGTMVVYFCETQILERKVPQSINGFVRRQPSRTHFLE